MLLTGAYYVAPNKDRWKFSTVAATIYDDYPKYSKYGDQSSERGFES